MRILAFIAALCLASAACANPSHWRSEWPDTDFEQTNIAAWSEVISGGPPKDGIPAINDPTFVDVQNESRIGDREPVITVEIDGARPRAYPVRYLTWHEIVNDRVGGRHILPALQLRHHVRSPCARPRADFWRIWQAAKLGHGDV